MLLTSSPVPKIHVWTPGIYDFKGGIQTYSKFFLQALERLCPQAQIQIFSTHDRPVSYSKRKGFFRSFRDLSKRESSLNDQLNYSSNRGHTEEINGQFTGMGNWPAKLRIPAYGTRVVLAGLRHQPDLVIATHSNFTPAAHYLKQLSGIPYWTVAHGFEVWDLQRPKVQKGLQNADRILSVSEYTRQRLIAEQPICPEKIVKLPNTFDLSRFKPAEKPDYLLKKYGFHLDQPICLTVNRLPAGESFHPYDQVLHAMPEIKKAIPDFHYVIVGEGDDQPRLEQLIETLGLQDCVTLTGYVSDDMLPDYYNLCDVFAMPSKMEGFGIVLLEAMACGKPVLGSSQDGSRDALDNGRLGALVNPDDLDDIANNLIQILQGEYPNELLYHPEALSQSVVSAYGMHAFENKLSMLLQRSPLSSLGVSSSTQPITA